MKKIKTSNIILIIFGIAILILVIAQVVKSTYHPNNNSENAVYTELKTDNIHPFKYLVLNGYRNVTYEVKQGKNFKIEVFTDPRNTDSCKIHFSNDTLYLKITNNEGYTSCANTPDVKVTVPQDLNNIRINWIHADIMGFTQDSLNILIINDTVNFKLENKRYEFSNVNIKNCKIKSLNYSGGKSELSIDESNTIEKLNFNSKGNNSRLYLNDVIIGNLNLNQDSANVILSGKAINFYLKK